MDGSTLELRIARMQVRIASESDLPAWQDFVDRAPGASCMHHVGWLSVLKSAYWVTPYFLIATSAAGDVQGILPLYHSRSPLTGPYVSSLEDGALANDADTVHALMSEARAVRDRTRAGYLQIRGGPIDEPAPLTQPTVRTFITTSQPAESLWSAVKKKDRWAVRQAEKQPIRVEHDPGQRGLEDFYRTYAEHMHELGTPVMGLDAFRAMRTYLGTERLRLYLVKHGERLLGGMLCIVQADRWTDYYAIVRPSDDTKFANYLLYWFVIRDASARGVSRLDLGRSTPDSNVHLFKRKWGGTDVEVPYHFYPARNAPLRDVGLQQLKRGKGLPQRIWSRLPLALCNRLGPLLRKQLPFI
jgi:serine/alanine adding enzyme